MILEIIFFILGVHLTMVLVAACYRIIDLWYRLSDFVVGIVIRILIVAGVIGLCLWGLEADSRNAFVAGQLFFLTFHITIYWLGRVLLFFLTHRS